MFSSDRHLHVHQESLFKIKPYVETAFVVSVLLQHVLCYLQKKEHHDAQDVQTPFSNLSKGQDNLWAKRDRLLEPLTKKNHSTNKKMIRNLSS